MVLFGSEGLKGAVGDTAARAVAEGRTRALEAEIKLKVTISNVGHEPALNVLPAVAFLSFIWVGDDGKNIDIRGRQKALCDGALPPDTLAKYPWTPDGIGQSLLPGETRVLASENL
jgi:hypothetical protein